MIPLRNVNPCMPPLQKTSIDSREAFPGVIKVTPVPIEAPIHTRPVLQSHPLDVVVNTTLSHISTKHLSRDTFHWGTLILFLFLALSFGIILSKWGWNKITGQIWRLSSGWKGSLELEEEEIFLPDSQVERNSSTKCSSFTNIERLPSPTDVEPMSPEEWIIDHPRTI
jgi:hypothetical protein